MQYSKGKPTLYSSGAFSRKYSERELKNIRRTVRKWMKPTGFKKIYYHITEKSNQESILKYGLLPNEIDHCIFLTSDILNLSEYKKLYKITDPIVLEINTEGLKRDEFRKSFANSSTENDVIYLEPISNEHFKLLEESKMNKEKTEHPIMKECPRCKQQSLHPEEVMNSLSRRDNETYICNDCGTDEAMEDLK